MVAEVDAAIEAGDSIGGSFVVVAEGDADRHRLECGVGHAPRFGARGRGHGHPGRQGRRDRPRLRGRSFGAAAAVHDEVDPDASRLGAQDEPRGRHRRRHEQRRSDRGPRCREARRDAPQAARRGRSRDRGGAARAHRAQRRRDPAARGGRGRGDGRARPGGRPAGDVRWGHDGRRASRRPTTPGSLAWSAQQARVRDRRRADAERAPG